MTDAVLEASRGLREQLHDQRRRFADAKTKLRAQERESLARRQRVRPPPRRRESDYTTGGGDVEEEVLVGDIHLGPSEASTVASVEDVNHGEERSKFGNKQLQEERHWMDDNGDGGVMRPMHPADTSPVRRQVATMSPPPRAYADFSMVLRQQRQQQTSPPLPSPPPMEYPPLPQQQQQQRQPRPISELVQMPPEVADRLAVNSDYYHNLSQQQYNMHGGGGGGIGLQAAANSAALPVHEHAISPQQQHFHMLNVDQETPPSRRRRRPSPTRTDDAGHSPRAREFARNPSTAPTTTTRPQSLAQAWIAQRQDGAPVSDSGATSPTRRSRSPKLGRRSSASITPMSMPEASPSLQVPSSPPRAPEQHALLSASSPQLRVVLRSPAERRDERLDAAERRFKSEHIVHEIQCQKANEALEAALEDLSQERRTNASLEGSLRHAEGMNASLQDNLRDAEALRIDALQAANLQHESTLALAHQLQADLDDALVRITSAEAELGRAHADKHAAEMLCGEMRSELQQLTLALQQQAQLQEALQEDAIGQLEDAQRRAQAQETERADAFAQLEAAQRRAQVQEAERADAVAQLEVAQRRAHDLEARLHAQEQTDNLFHLAQEEKEIQLEAADKQLTELNNRLNGMCVQLEEKVVALVDERRKMETETALRMEAEAALRITAEELAQARAENGRLRARAPQANAAAARIRQQADMPVSPDSAGGAAVGAPTASTGHAARTHTHGDSHYYHGDSREQHRDHHGTVVEQLSAPVNPVAQRPAQRQPIMSINVDLGDSAGGEIMIFADSLPEDLAREFCATHGLGNELIARLTEFIANSMQSLMHQPPPPPQDDDGGHWQQQLQPQQHPEHRENHSDGNGPLLNSEGTPPPLPERKRNTPVREGGGGGGEDIDESPSKLYHLHRSGQAQESQRRLFSDRGGEGHRQQGDSTAAAAADHRNQQQAFVSPVTSPSMSNDSDLVGQSLVSTPRNVELIATPPSVESNLSPPLFRESRT